MTQDQERGAGPAAAGRRPENRRPRDGLGRPLPYGATGVPRQPPGVPRSPSEALDEAQRLLEAGLPFHAHEVLEDAWKAAPAAERDLWRGLAQLAVGATHAARGNHTGARALLRRGAAAIAPWGPRGPHGLDVAGLTSWAEDSITELADPPAPLTVPRLRGARPGTRTR